MFLLKVGHHRFGPVNHRGEGEPQCAAVAEAQCVAIFHGERVGVDAVVAVHHRKGLCIANNHEVGESLPEHTDSPGVVGLHVIYDEIVGCAVAGNFLDAVDLPQCVRHLHTVDNGDFF